VTAAATEPRICGRPCAGRTTFFGGGVCGLRTRPARVARLAATGAEEAWVVREVASDPPLLCAGCFGRVGGGGGVGVGGVDAGGVRGASEQVWSGAFMGAAGRRATDSAGVGGLALRSSAAGRLRPVTRRRAVLRHAGQTCSLRSAASKDGIWGGRQDCKSDPQRRNGSWKPPRLPPRLPPRRPSLAWPAARRLRRAAAWPAFPWRVSGFGSSCLRRTLNPKLTWHAGALSRAQHAP